MLWAESCIFETLKGLWLWKWLFCSLTTAFFLYCICCPCTCQLYWFCYWLEVAVVHWTGCTCADKQDMHRKAVTTHDITRKQPLACEELVCHWLWEFCSDEGVKQTWDASSCILLRLITRTMCKPKNLGIFDSFWAWAHVPARSSLLVRTNSMHGPSPLPLSSWNM